MNTVMAEYLAYANGIQVAGVFGKLIEQQQFDTLLRLGEFQRVLPHREVIADWALPWYMQGESSQRAWWDLSCEQYTVGSWAEEVADGKNPPQQERVDWFIAHGMPPGPALAIRDTVTHRTTMVDGCHRTCAQYMENVTKSVLVYESPLASVLFVPDFFRQSVASLLL